MIVATCFPRDSTAEHDRIALQGNNANGLQFVAPGDVLFRDLLPLLNSGRIVLPRNDRLQGQIVGLERRTSAVGRDTISHPDRGHDDMANAVAGAAALSKFGGYDFRLLWVSGDDDDSDWQRVRLHALINSGGRIRL